MSRRFFPPTISYNFIYFAYGVSVVAFEDAAAKSLQHHGPLIPRQLNIFILDVSQVASCSLNRFLAIQMPQIHTHICIRRHSHGFYNLLLPLTSALKVFRMYRHPFVHLQIDRHIYVWYTFYNSLYIYEISVNMWSFL